MYVILTNKSSAFDAPFFSQAARKHRCCPIVSICDRTQSFDVERLPAVEEIDPTSFLPPPSD
jgi:hypothetical protein